MLSHISDLSMNAVFDDDGDAAAHEDKSIPIRHNGLLKMKSTGPERTAHFAHMTIKVINRPAKPSSGSLSWHATSRTKCKSHRLNEKWSKKKKTNNAKKEHFWFHFCRLSAKKSSCMQSIVGAATRAFGVRCVCATCVWRRLSADCFLYYIKINVLSVLTTVRLRLRDGMISLNSHKLVGRCVIENNNFFLFCFMYTFDW